METDSKEGRKEQKDSSKYSAHCSKYSVQNLPIKSYFVTTFIICTVVNINVNAKLAYYYYYYSLARRVFL